MIKRQEIPAPVKPLVGIHRAVPIILFAIALFTMFCYIRQDSGALGHFISALFLGLFSYGAYAIPPLLAIHAIFYSQDLSRKRVLSRVIFSLIAITFISALAYSITYWSSSFTFSAVQCFKDGQNTVGGGFIGGIVGFCIVKLVGKVGLVIIAAAILAIYVTYFFTSGQQGLRRVGSAILHAILLFLASIEKLVLGTHRKVKNAKTEKVKRDADLKNMELTDDEFFDVDNGMQKLRVSALGIDVRREDTDQHGTTTLHDKIFHKSAVSEEEAEEMEMRERREEQYFATFRDFDDDTVDDEPLTNGYRKRHMSNIDYGDIVYDDETTVQLEFAQAGTVINNADDFFSHDDNADSIFTKDFDPFGMAMSEKLASKPSSRSMLDEQETRTSFKEDLSELTPEQIEREKRKLEFEERKAAILRAHKPTPVTNDGEFKGTQKVVDFHEHKEETVKVPPKESTPASFTFDKKERSFEAPKTTPPQYTSIGFSDGDSFSATVNKASFTESETIYTSKANSQNSPPYSAESYTSRSDYGNGMDRNYNASSDFGTREDNSPYSSEGSVNYRTEKPKDNSYTAYSGARDFESKIYERPKAEPQSDAPYSMDHSTDAHFTFNAVKDTPKPERAAYEEVRSETGYTESTNVYTGGNAAPTVNGGSYSNDNEASGTVIKEEPKAQSNDYIPNFKPYQAANDDEVKADTVNVITLDEKEPEPASTLTVERERVSDEDIPSDLYSGLDDDTDCGDDGLYDGLDGDEYGDEVGDEVEFDEADDESPFEENEIPEEEQNPVVQGFNNMFVGLHDDNVSTHTFTDAVNMDTEPMNTDNSESYRTPPYDDGADEEDEDGFEDEPPFDNPTFTPEPKANEQKKNDPKNEKKKKPDFSNYKKPPIDLLGLDPEAEDDESEINENTKTLIDTLASFNVTASLKGVDRGPRITRYEVVPARGVKVNSITALFNDIKLNLGKVGVRMEAPIPGKSAIGFEIPNKAPKTVRLRELIENDEFNSPKNTDTFAAIGKDVAGNPVYGDICKYPHALICGATGMGKSVCINSIMMSILYRARPDDVKFIMIDPKKVEFKMYSGIPHLLIPVITESKQAAGALMWAVEEMERRYELIETHCVRNIQAYNELVAKGSITGDHLPLIVIVIDELADLMMQVRDPVEDLIMRIAQKARASGIHLLIGTQRPSTNIITGSIKANIPSRLSCKVTSQVDSRTIFDMKGAEDLLNKGDMLYWPVDRPSPLRVQGAFVSDDEVAAVTNFLKSQVKENIYDDEIFSEVNKAAQKCGNKKSGGAQDEDDGGGSGEQCGYYNDVQFLDAVELAIRSQKVSTSLLQRKLSIGYGKAAKYIDAMEDIGVVSEPNGQKPRDVLITLDEWHEKLSRTEF